MSVEPGTDTQRGRPRRGEGPERRDVPAGRVALVLAGLVASLLLVCAAVAGLFALFDRAGPPHVAAIDPRLIPPEPRLQVHEPNQRRRLQHQAEAALADGRLAEAMRRTAAEGWTR